MPEKKFSQIAFTFEDTEVPQPQPVPAAPPSPQEEAAPVNIGVRIKAFKEAARPVGREEAPPPKKKSTRGRKSLKNAHADLALVNIPEDEKLFERQYYSIGEVAGMFGVNTSLIRYWANEFEMIKPRKNRKGDRHFRPADIKSLLLIHDLLRRKKLTIEGAKEFLKNNKKAQEKHELVQSLRKIRTLFQEIKSRL
mgnify:CR=1 FL=1